MEFSTPIQSKRAQQRIHLPLFNPKPTKSWPESPHMWAMVLRPCWGVGSLFFVVCVSFFLKMINQHGQYIALRYRVSLLLDKQISTKFKKGNLLFWVDFGGFCWWLEASTKILPSKKKQMSRCAVQDLELEQSYDIWCKSCTTLEKAHRIESSTSSAIEPMHTNAHVVRSWPLFLFLLPETPLKTKNIPVLQKAVREHFAREDPR